jgi:serine/threonine-protein kinase HipA
MSYSPVDVVGVSVWGRDVGAVTLDPVTNFYIFEYEDSWLADGVELAPLHMPRRKGTFIFPELSPETFHRLPAMLADALPDRFGNYLVNAWMATQGMVESRITPLDRLAYASDRAMGALTFRPPAGPSADDISSVQMADLVTAARAQISGNLRDTGDVHRALAELITVGSSAGGARAKAVLAFNPSTGQMLSGQLDAPDGYEQWLIKFDGVGDPQEQHDPLVSSQQYCRVEFAYYLMATSAGIDIAESMLWPEGPRMHFMTRRFDRGPNGERIHSQTLCALAHLDYNARRTHAYETYFLTARQLGLGSKAATQIFRRAVFNVMSVNRDDHAKNFSFLLPEHGAWQLAPAYDLTHSNWGASWTQTQQMSVSGAFEDITFDNFRTMGDRLEVPDIERTLEEIGEAILAWRDFAAVAKVDQATTDLIASDLEGQRPR